MEIAVNSFNKGINTDLDEYIIANDTMRYAMNIRLAQSGDNNYILTNVDGNEENFTLSRGFIPIGTVNDAHFTYIFSYNPLTNQGELGSVPSLNYEIEYIPNAEVEPIYPFTLYPENHHIRLLNELPLKVSSPLIRKYSPLYNYTTDDNLSGRYAFRSTLFNFRLDKAIVRQAVSKLKYDYSYDLYFTDNYNLVRTINGGLIYYEMLYKLADRVYTPFSFETDINLILNSNVISKFDNPRVNAGGGLKAGNYTLYMVYNSDGVKTYPICNTNKISIYYTQANVNYGGSKEISSLTEITEENDLRTDKLITIDLTNLDLGYKQFRIWVEYNSGDDININTYYEINRDFLIGSSTETITITGFESSIPISENEVSNLYYDAFRAKSITSLDSRVFLANINIPEQDVKSYKELALTFKASFDIDDNNFIINEDAMPFSTVANAQLPLNEDNGGYAHYLNIYNKLGYWGGEQYAFGIVFKLKNGTETQAFPITGYDFSLSNPFDIENSKNEEGIVKFPHRSQYVNSLMEDIGGTLQLKGLSLTIIKDVPFYNDYPDVIAYKIVRAERNKHCIEQGYITTTYSVLNGNFVSAGCITTDTFNNVYGNNWGTENTVDRNRYQADATLTRRVIPAPIGLTEFSMYSGNVSAGVPNPHTAILNNALIDKERYAFYSIDSYNNRQVREVLNDNNIQIKEVGNIQQDNYTISSFPSLVTQYNSPVFLNTTGLVLTNTPIKDGKSWEVQAARELNNGKFSAAVLALSTVNELRRFYYGNSYFNRYTGIICPSGINFNISTISTPVSLPLQVGDSLTEDIEDITDKTLFKLVNIYENVNRTYTEFYPDITALQYRAITDYTELKAVVRNKPINDIIYNGDCFVGMSFIKLWYSDKNRNQAINTVVDPLDVNFNTNGKAGILLQMITENNTNPYFRKNEVININEVSAENNNQRSYYPLSNLSQNILEVIPADSFSNISSGLLINRQVFQYVRGYQIEETKRQNQGYNQTLPIRRVSMNDPNLPFISNSFPTRVVYSEKQVGLSFKDSYRDVRLTNTQDYDLSKGVIYTIESKSGGLVAVQDSTVTILPYNERIQISNEGQVFMEGTGVLTQYAKYISDYGTQHTHSVVETDSTIYGIDVKRRKIWRLEGESIRVLSDFAVSSYLSSDKDLDRLEVFNSDVDITNEIMVRSFYDRLNKEVLFTFYHKDYNDSIFNLCFSEIFNVFTSFYSYSPNLMYNRSMTQFSFNVGDNIGFKHNVENRPKNTFYNEFTDSTIDFVINNPTEVSKVYDNHFIVGNNIYPSEIKWVTENQESTRNREWLLKRKRLRQEENRIFVVIGSSDTDKGEDYNHNRLNSRIRDKYVRVRIKYDTTKRLRIQKIATKYRRSYV